MISLETISINGQEYVLASSVIENTQAKTNTDGMIYSVVRTYSAGVHIGYVKNLDGTQCELVDSRRLYNWSGACSLSQVALDGVDVDNSKIAKVLPFITLTQAIEIIPCTQKAKDCIQGAVEWAK